MKTIHLFATALIMSLLLGSCGITGNGFGGSSIQKRKYTKGFYHNKNRGFKSAEDKTANELTLQEETTDEAAVSPLEKKSVQTTVLQQNKTIRNDQAQPQQPQRSDEKSAPKKKATPSKKESKTTPVRQRKQREHEYYVPMKEKAEMAKNMAAGSSESGAMLVLLVILAIIIPPLAVGIYEGITTRFWIDLILAIVGFGIGFALFGGGIAWLCGLAAVIYALLIVLGVI